MTYDTSVDFAADILVRCIDKNGMVKSQLTSDSSGNGITYTAMALLLAYDHFKRISPFLKGTWQEAMQRCLNGGDVIRTPDNAFGQESWDDYLAIASVSLLIGDTNTPRTILKYALLHAFIFKNAPGPTAPAFLGRFVQVWVLMLCAAFPIIKYPLKPLVLLIALFMKPSKSTDPSGINLDYMYACGEEYIYANNAIYKFRVAVSANRSLAVPFALYFGLSHPFTAIERQ